MQVRLLKSGDEALLQEAEALFWPDKVPSLAHAAALLREPTFVMVVAQSDDGKVMARVYGHVLHRFEATDLLLYEVDTVETHRREGAARAIIEYLGRLAAEHGWNEMWVLTEVDNEAGNGLYTAIGGTLENSPANMYVFKTGA
jgi:GNAT superfamily N-acetyltransferase